MPFEIIKEFIKDWGWFIGFCFSLVSGYLRVRGKLSEDKKEYALYPESLSYTLQTGALAFLFFSIYFNFKTGSDINVLICLLTVAGGWIICYYIEKIGRGIAAHYNNRDKIPMATIFTFFGIFPDRS